MEEEKALKIIKKIWQIFEEEEIDEETIFTILESIYITNYHLKRIKNKKEEI